MWEVSWNGSGSSLFPSFHLIRQNVHVMAGTWIAILDCKTEATYQGWQHDMAERAWVFVVYSAILLTLTSQLVESFVWEKNRFLSCLSHSFFVSILLFYYLQANLIMRGTKGYSLFSQNMIFFFCLQASLFSVFPPPTAPTGFSPHSLWLHLSLLRER